MKRSGAFDGDVMVFVSDETWVSHSWTTLAKERWRPLEIEPEQAREPGFRVGDRSVE